MSGRNQATEQEAPPPTVVEWGMRGLSAVVLLALLGFLLAQALTETRPPSFETRAMLDEVEERSGSYVLPVRVRNEGGESVFDLHVSVALRATDGGTIEEEAIVLGTLGHGQTTTVQAWFDADPRAHRVAVDIGTYVIP